MDLAFIGVEDHTVVFSDTDSSAPNRLRTLINENGIKSLYVSSYEGSGTDFARLTDSFRNMGWNVGMLKPSDIGLANSNDSLISPAFQDYIGTSKKDYNILFIPVPDSRHTYELVSDINTKGSGVLLNIRSGSISRPQLRTSLSGIDSSHVFAMIDRN